MFRTRLWTGLLLGVCGLTTTAVRAQDALAVLRNGDHPVATVAETVRSPLPVTIDIPLTPESVLRQPVTAAAPAAPPPAPGFAVAANSAESPCSAALSDCAKPSDIYHKGQIEVQAMSGASYHAFIGNVRSTGARMFFLPESLRVGVALNDPESARVFRGTWSAVAEWDTLPIVYGPGSFLVGGSLGLRYTASQRCSRFIPYAQFSFGAGYSDSYRSLITAPPTLGQVPTGLTSGTEFLMTNLLGAHYLLNSKWSLDVESSLTLITNFGIAPNHRTLYPLGVAVGVTRYLR